MSERGSPSDHTVSDQAVVVADAPAGASADATKVADSSGDANLSADASSASGDKGAIKDPKKPTLAEVIKTAASLDDQGKSPDPAKNGKDPAVDGNADPAKAEAHKPEDDEKLPFHTHPRWKEVIGQNKSLTEKVATLEPGATQFGKITEFMEAHSLNQEEVGEGFIIMAMLKAGDPRGLQKLDEYRDKLATMLGEKIPADIQAQIDSGSISEASGLELSKTRAGKAKSDAEISARRDADARRDQETQRTNRTQDFQAGVTAWEAEIRKTDPDFAKKESVVARYSRAIMQEKGQPKNRDEAVAIVKEAYAEVNKDFASALPAKQPSKHVPAAPSSHGAKQKPGSLLDAVRQAANL